MCVNCRLEELIAGLDNDVVEWNHKGSKVSLWHSESWKWNWFHLLLEKNMQQATGIPKRRGFYNFKSNHWQNKKKSLIFSV